MKLLVGGGLAALGLLAMAGRKGGGSLNLNHFPLTPGKSPARPGYWGPTWKNAPPPGYPRDARPTGDYGSARQAVEVMARAQNLGPAFVTTMHNLAHGESGETIGLPAHTFDARCSTAGRGVDPQRRCVFTNPPRPSSKSLITASGTFSWNAPAWQILQPGKFPWEATPAEEVGLPIQYYAGLWRRLKSAGATDRDAARGIRLWHNGPGYYAPYWERGRQIGFPQAWATVVDSSRAARIDRHLSRDGLAGWSGLQLLGLGYFPVTRGAPVQGPLRPRRRAAARNRRLLGV